MTIPKSWQEITLEQFIELSEVEEDSFLLSNMEIISIVADCDIEEVEEKQPKEILEISKSLGWLRKQPPKVFSKVVGELKYRPLHLLTLGEFIDLEHYTSKGVKDIPMVLSILYRRSKLNDWGAEEFEPYKYSLDERASVFLELPVTSVFGAYSKYLKFRGDVMKSYENLFQADIEEVEDLDPEDAKEEEKEKRFNKWSWERLIYDLANEDITKADHVTDLPLILVFNFLSMRYELKL
jgi:hypothetical protein